MITINLRPGLKRSKRGGGGVASLAGSFQSLASSVKNPLPLASVVAWILVIGFLGWTWFSTSSDLGALAPELEQVRAEHQRYRDFLAQKQREEVIRDSILAQIRTIQAMDGDRFIWPHVLDEVTRALPAFTWITNVSVVAGGLPDSLGRRPPVQFEVTGRTVDIQGYTRFLRQLEESPFLRDVLAVSAETVVENNRAVTAFVIRATHTSADSSFIRVVPVRESVVESAVR